MIESRLRTESPRTAAEVVVTVTLVADVSGEAGLVAVGVLSAAPPAELAIAEPRDSSAGAHAVMATASMNDRANGRMFNDPGFG